MQIIAGKSDYHASRLGRSDIRLGGLANSLLKIRRRQTSVTASGSEITARKTSAAVVAKFPAVAALSGT